MGSLTVGTRRAFCVLVLSKLLQLERGAWPNRWTHAHHKLSRQSGSIAVCQERVEKAKPIPEHFPAIVDNTIASTLSV